MSFIDNTAVRVALLVRGTKDVVVHTKDTVQNVLDMDDNQLKAYKDKLQKADKAEKAKKAKARAKRAAAWAASR